MRSGLFGPPLCGGSAPATPPLLQPRVVASVWAIRNCRPVSARVSPTVPPLSTSVPAPPVARPPRAAHAGRGTPCGCPLPPPNPVHIYMTALSQPVLITTIAVPITRTAINPRPPCGRPAVCQPPTPAVPRCFPAVLRVPSRIREVAVAVLRVPPRTKVLPLPSSASLRVPPRTKVLPLPLFAPLRVPSRTKVLPLPSSAPLRGQRCCRCRY